MGASREHREQDAVSIGGLVSLWFGKANETEQTEVWGRKNDSLDIGNQQDHEKKWRENASTNEI